MSLSEHCALKINSLVFSFSLTSDVDLRILLTATHDRKQEFLGYRKTQEKGLLKGLLKRVAFILYDLPFSFLSLDLSKLFERRGLLYFAGKHFGLGYRMEIIRRPSKHKDPREHVYTLNGSNISVITFTDLQNIII
ncbi:hypothetical protein PHYBLDRAFT_64647 [Phycomyces blakesleeanus NRRL 1555(-)]|uniref:Uncharacterized protein n=1 Tax=Phycomyces blakesleeanus (strain ATCC 8743b / DSM 1359 / FGSC 10004 / NBRC 33097 / NRRL 1555) TaxID=763407 RepID=A0A163AIF3_PHYB8|nr:hypothetical protein PHYBLDRAFT_64647 [Phycomyces blakesleeanus NRRL 1555(-)]OAD73691.1 hypothetical protein PHYBLDRAFT_64647 [Phycomyces blakesleeanus NRRL 1555(-)]|eukprot:XP_018291731.1 hypothetical protein PHYBLDRAFT_64647 [Phycomyces blakesleeanus NRRL 1555(-)]